MTMKIDRFEVFNIERVPKKVEFSNNHTAFIKDHLTDNIVAHVQVTNNTEKNKELARVIVTAIENYLEGENE